MMIVVESYSESVEIQLASPKLLKIVGFHELFRVPLGSFRILSVPYGSIGFLLWHIFGSIGFPRVP